MNSASRPAAPAHYASVQLLRFVAAIMVVLTHTTEAMVHRIPAFRELEIWVPGASGVDIFFVISGFVMAVSSRPPTPDQRVNFANAVDFCKRRLLRIVPLYWFYTVLKIVSVLALPALALRTTLDPAHLLASFFFVPWTSPWGLVQPVLPVGWTLNYEMLFYLIFAAAIALNLNRLLFCMAAFLALYLAAQTFPGHAALAFYGSALLFEFGIGMLIARLHVYRLPPVLAVLTIIAGIALLSADPGSMERIIRQGLGAGLLVFGGIQLERIAAVKNALEKVSVLGDISYSSYLCHSFLVPLSVALLAYSAITHAGIVVAITLLIVIAGSFASYFWLERPMTERLKAVFFRPSTTRTVPLTPPAPTHLGNL